jgi:hypothetical protein
VPRNRIAQRHEQAFGLGGGGGTEAAVAAKGSKFRFWPKENSEIL